MTVCRDRYGCWGSVELMRDSDDRPFDENDVRLLDALAPTLGTLVRRRLVRGREGLRARLALLVRRARSSSMAASSAIGWTAPVNEWLGDLGRRRHAAARCLRDRRARAHAAGTRASSAAARADSHAVRDDGV